MDVVILERNAKDLLIGQSSVRAAFDLFMCPVLYTAKPNWQAYLLGHFAAWSDTIEPQEIR